MQQKKVASQQMIGNAANLPELQEQIRILRLEKVELVKQNQVLQELGMFPEQNPTPIVRVDFNGNNLYQNQAAKELLKNSVFENHKFWTRLYIKMEANGFNTFMHEIKLDNLLYEVTLVPIAEKKYFNIYFRDITETVQYQNQLITNNVRLNSLLNSLQSAVVAEDIHGQVVFVNSRFCRLFQFDKQANELINDRAKELFAHIFRQVENSQDLNRRIVELRASKKEYYGGMVQTLDSKILEYDYIPIIENEGYSGQIWKFQDITETVKQRENLFRIEDKYRRIIEDLEFGLVEMDLNEVITKVYPAFCKMTGYSEEELVGKYARTLLAFEENKELLDRQNDLRKIGESSVYEVRMRTKKDLPKWVIISGTPIYNENNEIVGSIGIHLDISERKKLEEELKLANEQANSSVKAKEKFIANMSHEIRTPMNVILGMSELLQQNELSQEQRKYVSAIHNSADNLLGLITDILDFSKIESGYLSLDPVPTSLLNAMDLIAFSFKEPCEAKGVMFSCKLDPKVNEYLFIDANKLNQVFLNLVGNAVKFTQNGSVELSAHLLNEDDSFQTVRFCVRDTGIGILKKNYDLVFQSFRQEDESVSRNFGGTGLGLAITKRIVERMNGRIGVESKKNKGSCFFFDLTLEKVPNSQFHLGSEQKEVAIQLSHFNILVAEDNPMNQMLIQSLFSKDGIPFQMVNDGYEVFEALDKNPFDVILMDIQMPKMDGLTTVKELRKRNIQTPVLALTANVSSEEINHYLQCGMSDHVPKPFKKNELYQKILNVLEINKRNVKPTQGYSLKNLQEMSNGDEEFIPSILETFVEQATKHLGEINTAVKVKNREMLTFSAHQLKAAIDLLCIDELTTKIRLLEALVIEQEPNWPEIETVRFDVQHILTSVIIQINANELNRIA
jgi:PAS domain S-box-containing protein